MQNQKYQLKKLDLNVTPEICQKFLKKHAYFALAFKFR